MNSFQITGSRPTCSTPTSLASSSGEDDDLPELPVNTDSELPSINFTQNPITRALAGVNNESAAGSDQVSNRALHNTCHAIAPVLTCLFNKCMYQGTRTSNDLFLGISVLIKLWPS